MNKYMSVMLFSVLMSVNLLYGEMPYSAANASKNKPCSISESQCILRRAMDKLWADHVIWTRQFIVAALNDGPDTEAAVTRLMKNQEDLGDAIVPFYGAAAGKQLTKLLKEHILIAADLVKALKANKKEDAKKLDTKWHANALDIATFLSKANPHWPKNGLVDMLNKHLELTSKEVMARLNKNWVEDTQVFDQIYDQAREMGQALADGIKKQFPEKFVQ